MANNNHLNSTTFSITDTVGTTRVVPDGGYTDDARIHFSGVATTGGTAGATLNIWASVGGADIFSQPPTLVNSTPIPITTVGGAWSFTAPNPAADNLYSYYVTDGRDGQDWSLIGIGGAVPINGTPFGPFDVVLDTTPPAKPSLALVFDNQETFIGPIPNGADTNDQTLSLYGWTDPASIVQIYNGSTLLTTDALLIDTGPIIADGETGFWQYTFPAPGLPLGSYDFNVQAVDDAGNVSLASNHVSVNIRLDAAPPPSFVAATSFTATDNVGNLPTDVADGGYTNDKLLDFSGTAIISDTGTGVPPTLNIWVDIGQTGHPILLGNAPVDAQGNWHFTIASPAADGIYAIYVTDGKVSSWTPDKTVPINGVAGPETAPYAPFEIQVDTVAPAVPAISSVDEQTLTLAGSADAAANVDIFNNGALLATGIVGDGLDGHWQYTFPVADFAPGHYELTAKATDEAGNTSDASAVFVVDHAVCFLEGTRLQTPGGEVAVEDLKIGDLVSTSSGQQQAIKWIGRRSYVTRFLPSQSRHNVVPVRIARGALAENVPHRDLYVSPEHAMCLQGALIPARHLVNAQSIAFCESVEVIEYYHIELARHDLLIAEGAATESWLDCGNRNFFMNAVEYLALGLPDQAPGQPCLPFVNEGPLLDEVRTRLLARATALGYDMTTEADTAESDEQLSVAA
jgi:hypothetical protein